MPTGYTSELYDGKSQTLSEFALNCCNAFGIMVEFRDTPNAQVPEKFDPDVQRYDDVIARERSILDDAQRWTLQESQENAEKWYQDQLESRRRQDLKSADVRRRYQNMMSKVDDWTPPSEEYVELKDFMLKQLQESIDFDCKSYGTEPIRRSGEEHRKSIIDAAQRTLGHYLEQKKKAILSAKKKTRWVRELRESLQEPVEV